MKICFQQPNCSHFGVVGKTVCGIDLLSFNNLLCCILNPIDSLIDRRENMSDMTCRNHFIRSWMSHSGRVRF